MKSQHQDMHTPKILLKDYYKTPHWKQFRLSLTNDKNCKCDICGIKRWEPYKCKEGWKKPVRMDVHHLHYHHLFKEQRSDVLVLCTSCHAFCHQAEMMSRTRNSTFSYIYQYILDNTPWRFEKYVR